MIADFFTKPLQGSLFAKFRDVILGHKHISSVYDNVSDEFSSQERVRNNVLTLINGGDENPSHKQSPP